MNGWRVLAFGMAPGVAFAALAALLLGSQVVAGEAEHGSLRSLLTRPVSRSVVVLAKALSLVVVAVLLTASAYLGAVVVGAIGSEFSDVVQLWNGEPLPGGTPAGVMWQRSLVLAALTPLTVLAAAWLGLLVSVITDRAGVAATGALFAGLPLALLAFANAAQWRWLEWLFTWPLRESWRQFEETAGHMSTRAWIDAPIGAAAWLPGLTAVALLSAALLWFQRRDVLA